MRCLSDSGMDAGVLHQVHRDVNIPEACCKKLSEGRLCLCPGLSRLSSVYIALDCHACNESEEQTFSEVLIAASQHAQQITRDAARRRYHSAVSCESTHQVEASDKHTHGAEPDKR